MFSSPTPPRPTTFSRGRSGEQRVVHLRVGADDHPVGRRQVLRRSRGSSWADLDDARPLAQPRERRRVGAFGDEDDGSRISHASGRYRQPGEVVGGGVSFVGTALQPDLTLVNGLAVKFDADGVRAWIQSNGSPSRSPSPITARCGLVSPRPETVTSARGGCGANYLENAARLSDGGPAVKRAAPRQR